MERLLVCAPEEVVVVGNGPSPSGSGWGERIDRADFVVRMWDSAWQSPEDYGRRLDASVYTLHKRDLSWFSARPKPTPARSWWAYEAAPYAGEAPTAGGKPPTVRFQCRQALRVARKLGASTSNKLTLTRGTAAATQALLSLIPRRLVLVGFDDVMAGAVQEEPYAPGYREALASYPDAAYIEKRIRARKPGTVRSPGHDRSVERRVIEIMAGKVGARVLWAGRDWPDTP